MKKFKGYKFLFCRIKFTNSKKIENKLFDKNFKKYFNKNFKGNELYLKVKKQKVFFNILKYNYIKNRNRSKIVRFQIRYYSYVIYGNHINLILNYFDLKLDIIKLKNKNFKCIKIHIKNISFFEKLENKKLILLNLFKQKSN